MELDLFGPRVTLLTERTGVAESTCLFKGTIPPGTVIHLHAHVEREIFYILSGELDIFSGGSWRTVKAGDVLDVASNAKHAVRNVSAADATVLIVTEERLFSFFLQVGRPVNEAPPGPPTPADIARFVQTAQAFGHWLASPPENAEIGL